METELSDGGFIELALGGYVGLDGGDNDCLYDCMILVEDCPTCSYLFTGRAVRMLIILLQYKEEIGYAVDGRF